MSSIFKKIVNVLGVKSDDRCVVESSTSRLPWLQRSSTTKELGRRSTTLCRKPRVTPRRCPRRQPEVTIVKPPLAMLPPSTSSSLPMSSLIFTASEPSRSVQGMPRIARRKVPHSPSTHKISQETAATIPNKPNSFSSFSSSNITSSSVCLVPQSKRPQDSTVPAVKSANPLPLSFPLVGLGFDPSIFVAVSKERKAGYVREKRLGRGARMSTSERIWW